MTGGPASMVVRSSERRRKQPSSCRSFTSFSAPARYHALARLPDLNSFGPPPADSPGERSDDEHDRYHSD